ncbi:FAD/NAD(P)-binding domain-containing protein [Mycena amicta]|nr:FAD/NAD(P)-binding domain-containing protein [Mycena amicta]
MDSARPLTITIVGAGLGGLSAAIALRRCGHVVRIFESSQIKTEIGAGISMQANSLRILKSFGYSRENLNSANFDGIKILDAITGQGRSIMWRSIDEAKAEGINSLTCHRSDMHDELKRVATSEGDFNGPPAELHLGSKVVGCDPEAGTISLANGEQITADLVIGADGIHSVIRASILGETVTAPATGWSCFRCLLDASTIDDYPELSWLREGVEGPWSISDESSPGLSIFFTYFIRGGTLINFVGFHVDPDQDDTAWTRPVTKADILSTFPAFHPKFRLLLDLPSVTPILRWQLRAMPMLPTWIKGRTAILGDAAHATLPLLGQGAAMAIEEAATLGCLLPFGTKAEDVPKRLEAFQELRKERGEFVNRESVAQALPKEKQTQTMNQQAKMRMYLVGHDAIKVGQEYYEAHFGNKSESST